MFEFLRYVNFFISRVISFISNKNIFAGLL